MKKNKQLHFGFTVAELLLSMLVVMVIAVAMVPIIGPKKIKVTRLFRPSGIFECYYNEEGVLMQYYANNRGFRDAQAEVSPNPDYCVFMPPKAQKYEIFAIGAGSPGKQEGDEISFNPQPLDDLSGLVRYDHFQEDIKNLKQYDSSQAAGIQEASLADSFRNALNEWADQLYNSGSYLYVKIDNVVSPIDRAGNGASRKTTNSQPVYDISGNQTCSAYCTDIGGCPPYEPPEGNYSSPYFIRNDTPKEVQRGLGNAASFGFCSIYVHGLGGLPYPGRRNLSPIYFAIDGTSNFRAEANTEKTLISTNTKNPLVGRASLQLNKVPNGTTKIDAYLEGTTKVYAGQDVNPSDADAYDIYYYESAKAAYRTNGSGLKKNDFTADVQNCTTPEGLCRAVGTGYSTQQGHQALSGRIEFPEPGGFQWSYSRGAGIFKVGGAGSPGQVRKISYNNVRGDLYLFPGLVTGQGSTDTVVSKTLDRDNLNDRILHAQSGQQAGNTVTYPANGQPPLALNSGDMPLGPEEVRQIATPDNDALSSYISRIRATGFKGGLYNCMEDGGFCPGTGGAGAYPYLDNINLTNKLTIKGTRQKDGKDTFEKNYSVQMSVDDSVLCEDGSEPQVNSQEKKYCKAGNAQGRGGAVIIIW